MKKSIVCVSIVLSLLVSFSVPAFAQSAKNESLEGESTQSALEVSNNESSRSAALRSWAGGVYLFSIAWELIAKDVLVTSWAAGKKIPQGYTKFGIDVVTDGSVIVGVCWRDSNTGAFTSTGSATIPRSSGGPPLAYTFTTSTYNSASDRYAFAKGNDSFKVSGSASITAIKN